jgi:hypothetical protein
VAGRRHGHRPDCGGRLCQPQQLLHRSAELAPRAVVRVQVRKGSTTATAEMPRPCRAGHDMELSFDVAQALYLLG